MLRKTIKQTISRICSTEPKRRRRRKQQPSDAQQLEQRTLLTGNVVANFSNGTLTLTGDGDDNSVTVAVPGGAPANSFSVIGVGGTTINGQSSMQITGANPATAIKNLKLDFQGGDDSYLSFLPVSGNVTAKMGPGSDSFSMQDLRGAGKNVKLDMGSATSNGVDEAFIAGPITGNLNIKGGTGGQRIRLASANVAKNVKVNLGSARVTNSGDPQADEFRLSRSEVGGSVSVKGTDGSQRALVEESTVSKNVNFNLGDDSDAAAITGLTDQQDRVRVNGNATVKLGSGQDFFLFGGLFSQPDARVGGNLKVDMGSGGSDSAEFAILEGSVGRAASFKGTSGQQAVQIDALNVSRNLSVKLGDGRDTLVVTQQPSVGGRFRADGGRGTDTLDPAGPISHTNFETVTTDSVDPNPGLGSAAVFNEAYYDAMVSDAPVTGAGNSTLIDAMETLAGNPSPSEATAALAQIASIRGVDQSNLEAQYLKFLALKQEQINIGQANNQEAVPDLSFIHFDFMGSTEQLRYGKVVGDVLGLDPVLGALLNPTGGLVGPGNVSVNLGNHPVSFHGAVHDAAGYLFNYHNEGPGYDYLGNDPNFDTSDPLAGQIEGVKFWYPKLGNPDGFQDQVIQFLLSDDISGIILLLL